MWLAITIVAVVLVFALAAAFFRVSDPCPRCGSRWKVGPAYDAAGKLVDPTCFRCGHRWTPEWIRRTRERGK